jgi:hypothetical protein
MVLESVFRHCFVSALIKCVGKHQDGLIFWLNV